MRLANLGTRPVLIAGATADLWVSCRLNGDLVQSSRTSDLIFSVSTIIEYPAR